MERKFDSRAFYQMSKIQHEIEDKLKQARGNANAEESFKEQLKIINRCINTLYL